MPGKTEELKFLSERFDLVKKMYFSDKIIAANKKDLIFNWFLEQFGDSDKKSGNTYKMLWKTFHEILESEKQSTSHQRILIKSNLIKNLLNAVVNYPLSHSWASAILSSIAIFLETPSVNATLIADTDTLYLLLIAALKIICEIYKSNSKHGKSLREAKNLCNVILNILENLSASNEEEKALLLSESLQNIALFVHIAKDDKELDSLSDRFAKKMIAIVFNLKSKQYETLLTPADVSCPVERPNTFILQFFFYLHNMLMNEEPIINSVGVNEACASLIKKLLLAFLVHNKFSLHSLKIISLFFAVAGLDIPIVLTAESCCNNLFKEKLSESEVLLIGLSHVLEACLSVPQYFTSMVVPEEYLKPSVWLKGVSAALLDAKIIRNKSSWLKCFQSLVLISPSIIDDVLPLVKIVLTITVHDTESKKQYCKLFDVVLEAHSKLHQSPKFFVKFLLGLTECIKENTVGKFLTDGQILPQVEQSIARCVQELPYGQMIALWEIFIETFSTLENMCQVHSVNKGCMFFVAQLFSSFLLHAQLFQANIPSNIYSQFSSLIEKTCEEIKKIISCLKERDPKVVPLQKSVLLLCYTVGEVKLAYRAYYGKLENPKVISSEDIFNFSLLHDYLDEEYVSSLEILIDSEDKLLSVLIVQLFLQKLKAVQFKELLSEKDKSQMKGSIAIVLKYLKESCSGCESWDTDLSTVSAKNYGTVLWKIFLNVSPLILNHLDPRDFYDLCHSAQNVILQNTSLDAGAKAFILDYLKSEFFQESQLFQTAFVSVIWKQENLLRSKKRSHDDMEAEQSSIEKIFLLLNTYHLKALKYTKRTPKSDKNLGSVWNEIKEVSHILNDMLLTETLPKEKLTISMMYDFIKLLKTLPLDYLLPGNQMKCIIGLSVLFFLIPQSSKSDEATALAKEISSLLVSIFEGVRSIWLFDFVTSGPYLKFTMKTVNKAIEVEGNNHDWAFELIEHLLCLIVRTEKSLNAVEPYISELAVKNNYERTTLIIYYAFLKKLSQIISRPHKQETFKESLLRVSSLTSHGFINLMKLHFKEDMDINDHACFIKCYVYILEIICSSTEVAKISSKCLEIFSTILETALNKFTNPNDNTLSDIYLLFISKICKYSEKLSNYISEDFISVSWKIVLSHFEEKQRKKRESLAKGENSESVVTESSISDNSLCPFCCNYANKNVITTYEDKENAVNKEILSPLSLSEYEKESLKELIMITGEEKLVEVFQNILKDMDKSETDMFSLQMCILIFQHLIDTNNTKCQNPVLNQLIQIFLFHLCSVASRTCSSEVCQVMVLIPVLNFMCHVVTINKNFLPKHILLQSLHCITPVPLDVYNCDYSLFLKSYSAVWNLVYNMFMNHTAIILPFPAPYLTYVAKLLKSLVKAGAAESVSKCDTDTFQQLQLCAQNMNRLLTVISRHKNEFSKLVPYLVADYVDTVQYITLESNIKEAILSGIHRLLDICSEDSIKMQAININYVCREIYGNLVKNYKQMKHIT